MAYEYLWVEKYSPQKIEECILPEGIKKQFIDIRDSKQIPNMILAGSKGIGKCLDPMEKIEVAVSDEIYEKIMNIRKNILP